MAKNNETTDLTGLGASEDFQNDEYNLVSALMEAAEYKESVSDTKEIRIKKGGKFLFSFRIRALSQSELQAARKKATKHIKNPAGAKYPPISGETNNSQYHNYLIYTATVDEDKEKIWGNPQLKAKYNIIDNADTVDVLLKAGEKAKVVDAVMEVSGYNDEEVVETDEYLKN